MPIVQFKDNRSPSVEDTIMVDGEAFDLSGSSVRFRMRLETGSGLKVDATAAITQTGVDPNFVNKGGVRYDWDTLDVDTGGEYVGWWQVTLASGKTQDTDEFGIVVVDHALGNPSLCSLADVREELELSDRQRERDERIRALIPDYSLAIMREYEREWAPAADATRTFAVRDSYVDLAPYDLRAATAVRLHPEDASPLVLTQGVDYTLEPFEKPLGVYSALQLSRTRSVYSTYRSRFGYAQLEIAGSWGFASVPRDVRRAAAETIAATLRRDVPALELPDLDEPRGLPSRTPVRDVFIPLKARMKLRRWNRYGSIT